MILAKPDQNSIRTQFWIKLGPQGPKSGQGGSGLLDRTTTGKYMDDSIKEQSKRSVESYIARDIEKNSDWEKRDKRQVSSADYPMPVPQTDSEAAKGTLEACPCPFIQI